MDENIKDDHSWVYKMYVMAILLVALLGALSTLVYLFNSFIGVNNLVSIAFIVCYAGSKLATQSLFSGSHFLIRTIYSGNLNNTLF